MSDMNKGVPEDMREVTRDILGRVDVPAFSIDLSGRNKGCNMVHTDGSEGYITLMDALSNRWRVYDMETDELHGEFKSIEEVLDCGWKVST